MNTEKNILLVAGEVSGDMHAARLVRALQRQHNALRFWGIGGEELQALGMECLYDVDEMSVLGLSEVIQRYPFFRRVFRRMCREALQRRPDAVILVDYPGFNLRFAEWAHRQGFRTVYYICPQVWAWHRSRMEKMAEILDLLLVIFPFEKDLFAGRGLDVEFVGHPLVDKAQAVRAAPPVSLPWTDRPKVALLPGSRKQEISRMLPVMLSAAGRVRRKMGGGSALVAAPNQFIKDFAGEILRGMPEQEQTGIRIVPGQTRRILQQADAAMVASGTATIEAALMRCPMVVVYKTAWLTYLLGRMLVRVPHIGMVNVVAGCELCPEFIQHRAEPRALAEALLSIIDDSPVRRHMLNGLRQVAQELGRPQGLDRAAGCILDRL
jgi:lipid-A-disaccharide synthase